MLNFVLFFVAAIGAVILGSKTKVNMGIWAFLFAFILGFFRAGMAISKIIALFPASIFYAFLSSALFYGFGTSNGTIDLLARKLVYGFRRQVWMGPLVMFVVGAVISLCGCNGTTGLILSAMCYAVAAAMGCYYIPILVAVHATATGLGMYPWTSAGAVNFSSMIQTNTIEEAYAGCYLGGTISTIFLLIVCIVTCIKYHAFRKKDVKELDLVGIPEKYNKQKKATLTVVFVSLALIVIPTLIAVLWKTPFTKKLSSILSVQVVWTAGIIVLTLMNLGDLKSLIVKKVPWNSVVLITGMCTLFNLASTLGVVNVLAGFLSSVPTFLVLPCLAAICAILSFFVSGLVVGPFFFPLCSTFASITGAPVGLCFAAVISGGGATSISPASSGGAYLLSAAPNEDIRSEAMGKLFKIGIINVPGIFVIWLIINALFV